MLTFELDLHKVFADDASYNSGHGHAFDTLEISSQRTTIVVIRPDQRELPWSVCCENRANQLTCTKIYRWSYQTWQYNPSGLSSQPYCYQLEHKQHILYDIPYYRAVFVFNIQHGPR